MKYTQFSPLLMCATVCTKDFQGHSVGCCGNPQVIK